MGQLPGIASPLFLREAELRRGIELLFFGYGSLLRSIDDRLAAEQLGRAHHRALYFVARHPDLSVGALGGLLGVTKQSLGRVLGDLIGRGLIERRTSRDDRRQRLLRLTPEGRALETTLFEALRTTLAAAYVRAGQDAVGGFWAVLEGLVTPDTRARLGALSGSG